MPGVLADCGVEHVVCYTFTINTEAGRQERGSDIRTFMDRSGWCGASKIMSGIDGTEIGRAIMC